MKAHVAIENGESQPQGCTPVSRAIDWLQNYIDENPYTDAAKEARSIIYGLQAVRQRPALDELLALIGQIAKSDLGLEEISKAKIRMSQSETAKGEEVKSNAIGTDWPGKPAVSTLGKRTATH